MIKFTFELAELADNCSTSNIREVISAFIEKKRYAIWKRKGIYPCI